jgi:hypothetical protein
MITIKDTKDIQTEIKQVIDALVEIRDKSIESEIENLFIDMEKIFNVLKKST